jgi:hypothetical protein
MGATNWKGMFSMSLRTALLTIAVLTFASGTAVASGVTSVVFGDGGSPAAGHSSAVGVLSSSVAPGATNAPNTNAPNAGGVQGERVSGTPGTAPGGSVAGSGQGGGALPFTGFVALFILITGVALLGAGLLVRLKSRRAPVTS